jgi:hypothetical protein
LLLLGFILVPAARSLAEEPPIVSKAARVCLIFGHPGDDDHRRKFQFLRSQLVATLQARFALPANSVSIFDAVDIAAEPAPREQLLAFIRDAAATARPDAAVWFIFVGHANSTRTGANFNLPGPDLSEADLRAVLESTPAMGPLVFILTQSVSGRWVRPLAGANRFILSATRPYEQDNETEMPGALAAALAAKDVDANGDGIVSLLELFQRCEANIRQTFAQYEYFQMETPTLEANGDGRPTARPAPEDANAAMRIGLALTPFPNPSH